VSSRVLIVAIGSSKRGSNFPTNSKLWVILVGNVAGRTAADRYSLMFDLSRRSQILFYEDPPALHVELYPFLVPTIRYRHHGRGFFGNLSILQFRVLTSKVFLKQMITMKNGRRMSLLI